MNKIEQDSTSIVLAIIINNEGQVLISLRNKDSFMGDLWEFPGGKVQSKESTEDALHREVKEELGITIKIEKHFISFPYSYNKKKLFFTTYICRKIYGVPKPLESQKVIWVNISDLVKYKFPSANNILIDKMKSDYI